MIQFNADLIDDLAKRRVVFFIGAGVSSSANIQGGKKIPDWEAFLRNASEKVTRKAMRAEIQDLISKKNYLLASQLLKVVLKDDWRGLIENSFGVLATPSDLHRAIIKLDQRILVTTNFDHLLEDAWASENQGTKTHHPVLLRSIDESAFNMFRDARDYIVKLHGDVENPESIVFDTSSYQHSAFGNAYYRDLLNALLLTHTFMFVGFSMSDPAVSLYVESFAHAYPNVRPHYIFSPEKMSDQVKDLWKGLRKMYVLSYSPANDHAELTKSLVTLQVAVHKRRAEILAL